MSFSREHTKIAKAVAVILMCAHHLFAFPEWFSEELSLSYTSLFSYNFEYLLGIFGKICVAMFVCLSGYGTYISLSGKNDTASKITKKIGALYKKYWAVFLIFIPIGMILGVERITINWLPLIYNFTGISTSYNGEWWFFSPFIILCIISPFLIRLLDKKRSSPAADLLFVIIAELLCTTIFQKIIGYDIFSALKETHFGVIINRTIPLIPSFLMGGFVAKYRLFDKYLDLFNKFYTAIPVSLAVMLLTVYVRYKTGILWDFVLAPVFIIASVAFICAIPPLKFIAKEVGSVSTEIWLTHSFFLYYFIPNLLFKAKYSLIILALLVLISYSSGKLIVIFTKLSATALSNIRSKLPKSK